MANQHLSQKRKAVSGAYYPDAELRRILLPQSPSGGFKSVLEGCGYVIIHDAVFVPESKAEEALHLAKKAALDWFGDDQMFSL